MKFFKTIILMSFFMPLTVQAGTLDPALNKAFDIQAAKVGVNPSTLKAICKAESDFDKGAISNRDGGPENPAIGVCQILYKTAQDFGWKPAPGCLKNPKSSQECSLMNVYVNIYYAARIYKKQLTRYNGNRINAIAAYNTGTVMTCESGVVRSYKDGKVLYKCIRGGLLNQKYVDRVLKFLEELSREGK